MTPDVLPGHIASIAAVCADVQSSSLRNSAANFSLVHLARWASGQSGHCPGTRRSRIGRSPQGLQCSNLGHGWWIIPPSSVFFRIFTLTLKSLTLGDQVYASSNPRSSTSNSVQFRLNCQRTSSSNPMIFPRGSCYTFQRCWRCF